MKSLLIVISFFIYNISTAQMDNSIIEARKSYDLGDYNEAYIRYKSLIEKDSTTMDYYEKMGLSAVKIGRLLDAKNSFIHITKVDSTHKIAISQLASLYEQEGNTPKAVKYYTQLVKLFPENAVYYRKLAQNYASSGALIDAFRYYSEAYKLNREDLYTIKGISEIFLHNEQYQDADTILTKGLVLDSTNINFHYLISRSKYKQKDYDSTIYYLKQIEGKVDLSPYYNKLYGYSLIQIDSFDQSIYYLNKALRENGSKEYAHYYLATAYENLENLELAEYHYKEALSEGISNNVSNYHRSLAKLKNEENDLKAAIPHYQDAYKYSKDPVLLFYLARASDAYYKDKSIAINYYKKYSKSKHNDDEYKKYAISRARTLSEYMHQSKE